MGDLSNKFIDESYKSLLHTTEDTGLTGTTKSVIQDGKGTDTALRLSTDKVDVNGDLQTGGVDRITSTGDLVNVSGNISQFTNDSGFISTIPPTYLESGDNISELTNDVGYLTTLPSNVMVEGENVSLLNNDAGYLTSLPTNVMVEGENVSLLTNDAGYLTSIPANVMVEGENVSLLNNDAGYISSIPTTYLQSGDNVSELVNDNNYLSGASGLVSDGINIKNTDPSTTSSINFNPTSIGIDSALMTLSNNLQVNGAKIDIIGASGSFQDIYLKHPTWTPNDATRSPGGQYLNFTDASGTGFNGYIGLNRYGQMQFINPQANFSTGQRFVFQGATAGSGEIYVGGFNTDKNSANWQTAYEESITGMTTSGQVLILEQRDGSTIQTTLPAGGGGSSPVLYSGYMYGNAWNYSPNMITASGYGQRIIMRPVWLEAGTYDSLHAWYQTASSQSGSFNRYAVYNASTSSFYQISGGLSPQPTTKIWDTSVDATLSGGVNISLGTPLVIPTSGLYVECYIYDNGVDSTMSGGFSSFKNEGVHQSLYGKELPYREPFAGSSSQGTTHLISTSGVYTSFPSDLTTLTSWTNTSIAPGWNYRLQ